jgi:hypothetical protein
MRKYLAVATICTAVTISPAKADTLRAGFPVCVSNTLLDQMYDAILQKDAAGMDFLFDHGCFMSKDGIHVSLLDRGNWGSQAHIRVYAGKKTVEAWASIGALESYQP